MVNCKKCGAPLSLNEACCPYCGEPVYEDDWSEESLEEFMCPICEDEDAEDE